MLSKLFLFQFDRWSDAQRKTVLEILISKCKNSQLQYTFSLIDDKIPITHVDFTRKLPRIITVYIMSFLDPRSLCRCAQVCWFWKYLSELDQIWMPKCFKFGWILPFAPTPFEKGIWKRHYLECVRGLQYIRPKVRPWLHENCTQYWKKICTCTVGSTGWCLVTVTFTLALQINNFQLVINRAWA